MIIFWNLKDDEWLTWKVRTKYDNTIILGVSELGALDPLKNYLSQQKH